MERMERLEGRVDVRVWERRIRVHNGRWRVAGRLSHGKGLDAEASYELPPALSVVICLNIALVPGNAERRPRHLEDEEVEFGIGGQILHGHVHDLDGADGSDGHGCCGVRQARGSPGRNGHGETDLRPCSRAKRRTGSHDIEYFHGLLLFD